MSISEAIIQFEHYQNLGYSKSETPNSACIDTAISALKEQQRREQGREYLIGVDFGKGTDYSAISVMCKHCNHVLHAHATDSTEYSFSVPQSCPMCGKALGENNG